MGESLFAGLGPFFVAWVRVGFGVEGGLDLGGAGVCWWWLWLWWFWELACLLACWFWHVMGGCWRCWRVDGVMGRDYGRVV